MCHHAPSNELKLGHTAEVNAHLVAANVNRLAKQRLARASGEATTQASLGLLRCPDGVVGNSVTLQIYDISLGKYVGTLGFNGMIIINGPLAAVVKFLLEVTAAARRPVGIYFWKFADFVSNLLGQTLLPTRQRKVKDL